ncbi:hypothetical protein [Bacteroides sp. BFG-606]|jgi:hypothetical protein|uniref:hypothetical protein n=1 Tax=Bacteroides sp. BFG-606 TaxID=2972763 RepID=UPI00216522FF|nr:hypothetical protein [Bacteroides sp. BFG-606]MCS2333630.1 hypothetical protein [Bacteroides sp. BFG-606]
MESQNEQESFNNGTVEQQKTVNLNFIKIFEIIFYVLGVIFITFGFKYYAKDLNFGDNPLKFYEEQYVGGDAYNYIISASRSSAVMVKSLIWMVLGCSSVIIGRTLSCKK